MTDEQKEELAYSLFSEVHSNESKESFNSIPPRKAVWLAIAELFNDKFTPLIANVYLNGAFELWKAVMLKVQNREVTVDDFENLSRDQLRGWFLIARVYYRRSRPWVNDADKTVQTLHEELDKHKYKTMCRTVVNGQSVETEIDATTFYPCWASFWILSEIEKYFLEKYAIKFVGPGWYITSKLSNDTLLIIPTPQQHEDQQIFFVCVWDHHNVSAAFNWICNAPVQVDER